jgi:1,4-dihydroxy-2-naphthoyl-CoA hydrolase
MSEKKSEAIWLRERSPADLTEWISATMAGTIGIEVVRLDDGLIEATMPVDHRTHQPFGMLHGGASVAFAETLGSVAAYLTLPDGKAAVGLEINANHLRTVRDGKVVGRATPIHLGRTTQVWEIDIRDEADRRVCISRLTMAVIDMPPTNE